MHHFVKQLAARMVPLRNLTSRCATVLTYHACYRERPKDVNIFDNLTPDWLYDQVSQLKKVVRFVPVDELVETKTHSGIASITFDDGYVSVIQEALPVLSALDVPLTIFVNTYPLEGKTFWRHKVAYIMNAGLTGECEKSLQNVKKIAGQSFYLYLKDPCNNSGVVERNLDRFLSSKDLQGRIPQHLASRPSDFVSHPLVWYGNHTHHHYVLSSLSSAEQYEEISMTKSWLSRIPGIQISRCVALPFGRADQANRDTLNAVRDLGYRALLLNRGGVNLSSPVLQDGVSLVDRFSLNESPIAWDVAKQFWASAIGLLPARPISCVHTTGSLQQRTS